MSTATAPYDHATQSERRPRIGLRQLLSGAAAFDTAMGIACLAAPSTFGGWLSIGADEVRLTGAIFLVAAVIGAGTARRPAAGLRWVTGANLGFALWCLALVAFAGPDSIGTALLVAAALTSAATAEVERRAAGR